MDILHSKNPQIRLFTVKRTSTFTPQNDVIGSWKEATPASVRDFSATAYYFGRLVNEILDVPVLGFYVGFRLRYLRFRKGFQPVCRHPCFTGGTQKTLKSTAGMLWVP